MQKIKLADERIFYKATGKNVTLQRRNPYRMKNILEEFSEQGSPQKSAELFNLLVSLIRPLRTDEKGIKNAEDRLRELVDILKESPEITAGIRWHIRNIIINGDISYILSDSGVAEGGNLFSEMNSRLKHWVLPELKAPNDLGDVIRQVFHKTSDNTWMARVSNKIWISLFELLDMQLRASEKTEIRRVFDAASVLSFRICGNILDKQFRDYPEYNREASSPFAMQNTYLAAFRLKFENDELLSGQGHKLFEELEKCRLAINRIKKDRNQNGAGVQQTFLLVKLERQITRLKMITSILDDDVPVDTERAVLFFKSVVYFESRKNKIAALLSDNLGLMAFQITEHKSHTGEHYIANNKKEYFSFFKSACGGGVFAAIMGIVKIMIHHLHLALFWQHFWFSINYAIGFVGIHVSGSTLATKQPSMTAAALAGTLDVNKSGFVSPAEVAITVGKVWRSQFVAFAGNLLVTFPIAFLLAVIYDLVMGHPIESGEAATDLLRAQNVLDTPVYIYASVTGVMLFISGIISGYYDNKVLFSRIPERVEMHPLLNKFFSKSFLEKLGGYLKYNLGSLAGNISLGFLLGFPAFFGNILAIPLDIRHITISTAHYAIGIYSTRFDLEMYHIIGGALGIVVIGFMNFLVSFSLAFFVAIKSRNIRYVDYLSIPYYVFRYAVKYPKDFVYPPKKDRMPEELNL